MESTDDKLAALRAQAMEHWSRSFETYDSMLNPAEKRVLYAWLAAGVPDGGRSKEYIDSQAQVPAPGVTLGGADLSATSLGKPWTQPLPSKGWLQQWGKAHGMDTSGFDGDVSPGDKNIPGSGNPDPTKIKNALAPRPQPLPKQLEGLFGQLVTRWTRGALGSIEQGSVVAAHATGGPESQIGLSTQKNMN